MKPILFALLLLPCFLQGQIVNIEDRRTVFTDSLGWHENLDIGINLIKNTDRVFSVSGAFQLEVLQKGRRILSISKFKFLDAGDENFINNGFQHLRFNRIFNNWLTFELFGQAQYNEQLFIKFRALGGSGGRFQLIGRPKQRIHVGLTYMYEFDEEKDSGIQHKDHRLSSYLSLSLKFNDIVSLRSTSYFQPLFKEWDDYRMSSESTLSFKISAHLRFNSSFQYSYDSRASAGAPKRSYSLLNSIRYEF